jgi:pyruvate dehydrogenase E2 component (dihydrolipoamide acetyltransferase)
MASLRAFTMPKWGIEMTEGTVAEWMVEEGRPFRKGDTLALIETDKITNEVEAEADGMFPRLVARPGETYAVGALIAVLAASGDTPGADEVDQLIAAFRPADTSVASRAAPVAAPAPAVSAPSPVRIAAETNISPAARALAEEKGIDVSVLGGSGAKGRITFQDVLQASLPPAPPAGGAPVDITPIGASIGETVFASPLAKRIAAQQGISLQGVRGTGPRGRIGKADVLALAAPAPAVAPVQPPVAGATGAVEIIRMSPMRKAIAKALTHSKTTIPHFYLRAEVRIDAVLALRAQARAATGEAPSINDYFVRACAIALIRHPDVNVQVHGDEIHRFANADIAVAVATDKGLLTPIVVAAQTLSVAAIARQVKTLAEKARAGKLQPADYQGGSFSISNLGMFGIDQFDAIINPPQGAILAIGAGERRPIEIGHALGFATMVRISLSCDHRAIDGAVGAAFMRTLKALLENPSDLMG